MDIALLIFIASALFFAFLNGLRDSANIVATVIASRAMSARSALALTAITETAGPLLFGVAVATTIGSQVLHAEAVTIPVVMASLAAAIIWNLITWLLAIPSSSSHALIGGMVGAAVVGSGLGAVHWEGFLLVLVALFISPILGLGIGWMFMRLILRIGRNLTPRASQFFLKGQWITAATLGLSYGGNDAQKAMGILAMGLVAFGVLPYFYVPTWVIVASALALALGTALGGWRLIKTLGGGLYRVRSIHAFASQSASALVILSAALLGGPVSTTQVIASSIVGAGVAERLKKVRWELAGQMALAWMVTVPASALLGGLLCLLLRNIL